MVGSVEVWELRSNERHGLFVQFCHITPLVEFEGSN